ncbi:MAG TPA: hypothetical protein VIR59_11375 [Gaiellaceae bacterium]
MYHSLTGWDGIWMTVMTVSWIAVWGAVVYAAVKMAHRPPSDPKGLH